MEGNSNRSVTDEATLEEFSRFQDFCERVIYPNQPPSFKPRSKFHNSLLLTACRPMTATAAPRGFLKSTTLARYRPLHRLVDPASRPELKGAPPEILIVSETTRLSKEHLAWIKAELTGNAYLHALYGDLTDPNNLPWNEDEIQLTTGARAIAVGYDSQIRGRHPTDIVCDDLESLRNMATEESLAKLKDWFYRVLMGSMTPETHLTVIGTIIARASLLSELLLHEEFRSRKWQALTGTDESPVSLWPERYPVAMLQKLKRRLGSHRFNAEYQNEPLGLQDQIIRLEWIRRHNPSDLTHVTPVHRFIACDPAFTEERWGDYSAIVILDELPDGRLFERLAWRKKVALPELRDTFMSLIRHYSDVPCTIVAEEVAAQKTLRQMIQELDPKMNIEPFRPDKDKARRMIDVSRYFEMGLVSIMTESLVDELIEFPLGVKDRCDALIMCLKKYEQRHPVINNSQAVEINPIKHLNDTELAIYAERFAEGNPSYHLPKPLRDAYNEAMLISDIADEFLI